MPSLLTLFNATLSAVTTAGQLPDYDRDATAGTSKFSGSERVFLTKASERDSMAGGSDVILHRQLLVDPEIGVVWAEGDVVTFTPDGSATETAIVRRFGTSGTIDSGTVTRLTFEEA